MDRDDSMQVSLERLADAVAALAARVAERDVRAQLHALSGLLRNLGAPPADARRRGELAAALAAALGDEDEPRALAAAARLARLEREGVRRVDWSAASGG
jgi:hypothetical protein